MTIYDIAREAGVSASSVSRVINNKAGVNAKTRQLVLELLKKHNYTSNLLSKGGLNQPSGTVGVLVGDIRTIHHTDSAYYIERELATQGYCCMIINTGHESEAKAQAIALLAKYKIAGAILIGSSFQTPEVERAIEAFMPQVPVVMVNGHLDLPNVYGVLADERNGVEKCVNFLAAKQHTRLAFVRDSCTPSSFLKEQGFINGMILLYPGKAAYWTYETGPTLRDGYDITVQIMQQHPNVEGIIYSVDLLAAGGVRALLDMKIAVPDKVAVLGIDNSLYGEICNPRITSLDNKMLESSMMAAHVLLDCLEGRPNVADKVMLPSEIIERETT